MSDDIWDDIFWDADNDGDVDALDSVIIDDMYADDTKERDNFNPFVKDVVDPDDLPDEDFSSDSAADSLYNDEYPDGLDEDEDSDESEDDFEEDFSDEVNEDSENDSCDDDSLDYVGNFKPSTRADESNYGYSADKTSDADFETKKGDADSEENEPKVLSDEEEFIEENLDWAKNQLMDFKLEKTLTKDQFEEKQRCEYIVAQNHFGWKYCAAINGFRERFPQMVINELHLPKEFSDNYDVDEDSFLQNLQEYSPKLAFELLDWVVKEWYPYRYLDADFFETVTSLILCLSDYDLPDEERLQLVEDKEESVATIMKTHDEIPDIYYLTQLALKLGHFDLAKTLVSAFVENPNIKPMTKLKNLYFGNPEETYFEVTDIQNYLTYVLPLLEPLRIPVTAKYLDQERGRYERAIAKKLKQN